MERRHACAGEEALNAVLKEAEMSGLMGLGVFEGHRMKHHVIRKFHQEKKKKKKDSVSFCHMKNPRRNHGGTMFSKSGDEGGEVDLSQSFSLVVGLFLVPRDGA